MTDDLKTKFEKDLKAFFPDIYRLNSIGQYDKFFWDAINLMLKMVDTNETGEIVIRYNCGRIDGLYSKENHLAGKSKDPNLSRPNEF